MLVMESVIIITLYIRAVTKLHAPQTQPRQVAYCSYNHFSENEFINDLNAAPILVTEIFDDVNDKMWYHKHLAYTSCKCSCSFKT